MIASCARLVGEPVVNRDGEEVGRIDRILVDAGSGSIAGVVLAAGGVFGLGERQYAVSWKDLGIDAAGRRIVLHRQPTMAEGESRLSAL